MKNILVPTDGSKPALRALEHAILLAKQHPDESTLYVLNIQSPITSHNVNRFFSADMLQDYYEDEGKSVLEPVAARLEQAGVNYQSQVKVGHISDVVKDFVAEHRCDHIVMGTRGLSPVPGLLLGSAATKIIQAVDIPVTLIK